MYQVTALLSRLFGKVKLAFGKAVARYRHWREHREHGYNCLYCAHHDTALRRQPKYTCPRCRTVYESTEK